MIVTEFAYNANSWKELNPIVCYLKENYRQEDENLTKILNDIRFEREVENIYYLLNNKYNKDIEDLDKKKINKIF